MAALIPRWEWRNFGSGFGLADRRFAALAATGVQDSDEVYFLGGDGKAIVKVRDALLDLKVLREVNAEGLERWEPVMKAPFPVSAGDIARVFAASDIAAPKPAREVYSLEQFESDFAGPGGVLRPVQVHKRRVRYSVGGCTCEVTEVTADGRAGRTIAIESEDPAAVVAAVAAMGLGGRLNSSYPRGLAAIVDGQPEGYAVIDVGTNSVKLQIAERADGGLLRTVADRAEVTRLGEGLEASGEISAAAAERTVRAIEGMVQEARRAGVRAIVAVGTAGLRIASNGAAVAGVVHQRTGVRLEVISGEDESRLAYLAVETGLGLPTDSLLVFDTGGGSSQFTFGQGGTIAERFSVNVGAARYTERFGLAGAVSPEALGEVFAAIGADLSRIDGRPSPGAMVGMGGAITNLAAVNLALATYDPSAIQGAVLDRAEIDRQIELYRSRDAAQRRSIVGLQAGRAEVILAGACIVRTVMEKLAIGALTVSDRGLRHGVMVERFG